MDYIKLLKLAHEFQKDAQNVISGERGAYEQVLEKAGLWFNDNALFDIFDKYGVDILTNIYVTVHKDLTVAIKIQGQHPKLALAAKDIQNTIGNQMTNALKSAAGQNLISAPIAPITWL